MYAYLRCFGFLDKSREYGIYFQENATKTWLIKDVC